MVAKRVMMVKSQIVVVSSKVIEGKEWKWNISAFYY